MDEVRVGVQTLFASESAIVKFYGKKFKIGSALHATGIGFLDYSIFMTMDAARDMIDGSRVRSLQPLHIGPDQISSILVKVDGALDVGEVAREIEKASPGVEAVTMTEVVASVRRDVASALWAALAAGAAFWALMLAATGVVFALTANEREREVGVLRAMGATKRHVFGLIVSEASILSGLGALLGVALSLAALASFRNLVGVAVGFPFTWQPPLHVIALAALCVAVASLSGAVCAALPVGRVCRKEPYEAIWHGMR
jgi:putative ABC transport system permease protein